ncbi:sulfur relay protein DsrC [Bathymodiolus thermophilus thioautotrophic gill symbiont]
MIANPEIESFEDLVVVLKSIARESDERFFQMDVKPDYGDTPENWEDRLEAAFY